MGAVHILHCNPYTLSDCFLALPSLHLLVCFIFLCHVAVCLPVVYCLPVRRNRVRAAAALAWPGNEIPTFKNNKENAARLDQLVMELLPDCSYSPLSLPGVCFSRNGIRQHILDTLNERRRRVHGGYDYEKVLSQVYVCVM